MDQNKPLILQERLRFADHIIRGVAHLHCLGIRIGIINTENIFYSKLHNVLKVNISRAKSAYNSGSLADDTRMLLKVVIKLIWDKDVNPNLVSFSPTK